MSILDELITDRTGADVSEWLYLRSKGFARMTEAEKGKWLSGMKGSYNAFDLNRITKAMTYLADLYAQRGYEVSYTPMSITHADGTTDTTWRMTDIPTESQMADILQSLCSFWAAVEQAEASVVELWENSGFGYVDMGASVYVGDYSEMITANGIKALKVALQSDKDLAPVSVTGTGWSTSKTDDSIVATYTVPCGVYQDIQAALDSLVLVCADVNGSFSISAMLSAEMRSGAVIKLGVGTVRWSSIINWAALEAYSFTWNDIESAGFTWADMEQMKMPANGGGT